ncbi:MAG: hypothetical protein KJO07_08335 [Deltaproteobacteria bacterium]|jgi:hypothetical protein|nr:hypothetical protein [Deltaproteobacteria bacterium]
MTRDRTDADLDLMLAYDGELDDERARELLAADEDRAAGLSELTELVRGSLEARADEHDEALAGLWDRVERRIHSNGAGKASASEVARPAAAKQPGPTFGERLTAWFIGHRSHFLTGAVSAAAVVLIMATVGPEPETRTEIRTVKVPAEPVKTAPVKEDEATPPEVESLEVYQGSGTILTLPGEDGESETSVIWLTPADAEDTMEGPI